MALDIFTLLIAVALATAFSAAARFLLYRLHPTVPGLAHWAWAGILAAIALAISAMHVTHPNTLLLSLAQLLIALGMTLTWDGHRRFVGRACLSRTALGALGLGMLILTALSYYSQSMAVVAVVNSISIGLISGQIARELLRAGSNTQCAMRATGWIYALNAIFFLLRAILAAQNSELLDVTKAGAAAALLLWWLCMTVAITLGMALMTGERLQKDLDLQASRDPLTGALNRRAFSQLAEREMARSRRNSRPLSVLMMDLDHFKQINDRLGHAGGDAALCLFVAMAGQVLRQEDLFCRFGGEEFVALLPDSSAAQAVAAAERLRLAYATEASTQDSAQSLAFAFTVSIGVREILPGEDLESAIRHADTALYLAKTGGRNRSQLAEVGVTLAQSLLPA